MCASVSEFVRVSVLYRVSCVLRVCIEPCALCLAYVFNMCSPCALGDCLWSAATCLGTQRTHCVCVCVCVLCVVCPPGVCVCGLHVCLCTVTCALRMPVCRSVVASCQTCTRCVFPCLATRMFCISVFAPFGLSLLMCLSVSPHMFRSSSAHRVSMSLHRLAHPLKGGAFFIVAEPADIPGGAQLARGRRLHATSAVDSEPEADST